MSPEADRSIAPSWIEPAAILGLVLVGSFLAPLASGRVELGIQVALGGIGLVWLTLSLLREPRSFQRVGITWKGLSTALPVFVAPAFVLALAASLDASRLTDELSSYFAWALFQQFLVVAAFWRHFASWQGLEANRAGLMSAENAIVALLCGLCFALAHLPNPGLMLLVFVAETVWILLFLRFRNLFALALGHALGALVASHALVPSGLVSNMNVGLKFLRG